MSDRDIEIMSLSARLHAVALDLKRHVGSNISNATVRKDDYNTSLTKIARKLLSELDRRNRFLDESLFSDPAWCILLDLFAQSNDSKEVSVTSACIGARVPATTALRWINLLVERNLLERHPDPRDARRVNLKLSPYAHDSISAYLAEIQLSHTSSTTRPQEQGLQ